MSECCLMKAWSCACRVKTRHVSEMLFSTTRNNELAFKLAFQVIQEARKFKVVFIFACCMIIPGYIYI